MGDVLDDIFIIREIGFESVMIGFVGYDSSEDTRVAVGRELIIRPSVSRGSCWHPGGDRRLLLTADQEAARGGGKHENWDAAVYHYLELVGEGPR